jgi:hypothetical protein
MIASNGNNPLCLPNDARSSALAWGPILSGAASLELGAERHLRPRYMGYRGFHLSTQEMTPRSARPGHPNTAILGRTWLIPWGYESKRCARPLQGRGRGFAGAARFSLVVLRLTILSPPIARLISPELCGHVLQKGNADLALRGMENRCDIASRPIFCLVSAARPVATVATGGVEPMRWLGRMCAGGMAVCRPVVAVHAT